MPLTVQAQDWKYSGTVTILTTKDGANLPAEAYVEGFPILVTLHKDFFKFEQARPGGEDLRVFSSKDEPLPFQIDEWLPAEGRARIWVRIPKIEGDSRQPITLKWGNPEAESLSNGKAVFNQTNGYLSVWHMSDPVQDEVGTLPSQDTGTSPVGGVVGSARHFPGKKGIFCGDAITTYPLGASSHSTEAWFRAQAPNTTIIGWGNEGGGRGSKVRMQFRSPPHLHIDSDFADVDAERSLPLNEWIHVVHTYDREDGKLYINGQLAGQARPLMDIKRPLRLWLGGWYDNYDFAGDLDEVRISSVARSLEWVRLVYENLKPAQTLVGPVIQEGSLLSVSDKALKIDEGEQAILTADAGGALKVYWVERRDGQDTVVASDQLRYPVNAGRVNKDTTYTLLFKAVYPSGVRVKEIPVTVKNTIAEPAFNLRTIPVWNGRKPLELAPVFSNMEQMQAKGATDFTYLWSLNGVAVSKQELPGKLVLNRSQGSGKLVVKLAVSNGGKPTVHTTTLEVTEPRQDEWIHRAPLQAEKPVQGQFYARDDQNQSTLHYNGHLQEPAKQVFLKLYADDKLIDTILAKPDADQNYTLSAQLKPGLIKYKVEFGISMGTQQKILETVGDLICGDAYIIDGQSNAEATDLGKDDPAYQSEWIRSYGSMGGTPGIAGANGWGMAVARNRQGGEHQVGYWGLELARRILESEKMPICLINGAVGGSRIDQHQRNDADPEDLTTIYGRLLWRVKQAGLTNGIRGVLWHQGENDQGADGPTGGFGWETYAQYFVDMTADWKEDYPNIQHYYVFQIWPRACSMGSQGSDNQLREVQRQLPRLYSHLSVMSTLGIKPPGGCHYPLEGYAEMARLIAPLVLRDNYGKVYSTPITPPNLVRVQYAKKSMTSIELEFDQPVQWNHDLLADFLIDGQKGKVASGSVSGNTITLELKLLSNGKKITYLDGASWSPDRLLMGKNGIATLTFCDVPIAAPIKAD